MSAAKRPPIRTRWLHCDYGAGKKTWIKIGIVKNPKEAHGYIHDCIRIQIRSGWKGQEDIDFSVRIDEAQSMACGFGYALLAITGRHTKELSNFVEALKKGTL
jgi:hypothetical protein